MPTEPVEQSHRLPDLKNRLPWVIGVVSLVLYFFTLNRWMTVASVPWMARVADWDWRGAVMFPLHVGTTFVLRALPDAAQFTGLNLMSALCAALTLGLLTRCVMILPQDKTREQRHRVSYPGALFTGRLAWMPPTVAAVLCGLQLTFWEHATVYTGEMLDLLLFAYAVRCLLEHRFTGKDSWIYRMAFVLGLGAANNWAMVGFLPVFLIALIWIKGLRFFNFWFLTGSFFCGLAGLLLYLVLPLVHILSSEHQISFLQALKINLASQKRALLFLWSIRLYIAVLTLPSLVAAFMIGIRWPSFHGDLSATAHFLTDLMFRLVHVMFLALCIATLFDPPFSARIIMTRISPGFRPPFLTFHFITALCIGYFIAYCLLVFGKESVNSWERASKSMQQLNRVLLGLAITAALASPIALLVRNAPKLSRLNEPVLRDFAVDIARSLPDKGAIILSDDSLRFYLLEGAYRYLGRKNENFLLETAALPIGYYHRRMRERYRGQDFLLDHREEIAPTELIQLFQRAQTAHPLYYLHPSFGYYFEYFQLRPRGLVYELQPLAPGSVERSALTPKELQENKAFWEKSLVKQKRVASLLKKSGDAGTVGVYFSHALNFWAVELQRLNLLTEARDGFARALALNPDNLVAEINREFNRNLLKQKPDPVETDKVLTDKLQRHTWQSAIAWFGPFDEPRYCLRLGQVLADGNNFRQAAQQFLRTIQLSPETVEPRLDLGKTYSALGMGDQALQVIDQLRANAGKFDLNVTNRFELLRVEAAAHLSKNDWPAAEGAVLAAVRSNPRDPNARAFLAQLYMLTDRNTNALEVLEEQLTLSPTNTWALFHKARLYILEKQSEKAIAPLTQLLQVDPKNIAAILNRAIAELQAGKLEAAWNDYRAAEKISPFPSFQIHYGLAEVAYQRKDKDAAIHNYKLYLKHAPDADVPGLLAEKKLARDRLKELGSRQ